MPLESETILLGKKSDSFILRICQSAIYRNSKALCFNIFVESVEERGRSRQYALLHALMILSLCSKL